MGWNSAHLPQVQCHSTPLTVTQGSEPELREELPCKEVQVVWPVARVLQGKVGVRGLGEFVGNLCAANPKQE